MSTIFDFKLGEGSCYISDNFISKDSKAKYERCEISEKLAMVMIETVKPLETMASGGYTIPKRLIINKEYICVAKDEYNKRSVFVYQHDGTYYLYVVFGR